MKNKYTLTGDEYTQLEKDAQALLIDYGFVEFSIDIFALAQQAYKADIVKYSSLSRKKLAKIKEHEPLNDGFTVFHKMSDGTKRYTTDINVEKFDFIGSANGNGNNQEYQQNNKNSYSGTPFMDGMTPVDDGEMPF